MGTVVVLSANKTLALLNGTIVGGVIDTDGNLILNKQDGSTVNLGSVGGDTNVRPMLGADIQIDGDDPNGVVETVTITDDGTSSDTWINRMGYFFRDGADQPTRHTSFFNEFGEFRVAPARSNTTALRIFVKELPDQPADARSATVPVFELMDDTTNRNSLWGVVGDGTVVVKGIRMANTLVLNAADPVPAGTPAGTVIVRKA